MLLIDAYKFTIVTPGMLFFAVSQEIPKQNVGLRSVSMFLNNNLIFLRTYVNITK